jgi:hypothetical protein
MYSYTRPVRAMHDLYKSALALCVLFYFLRLLYVYSSPYSTRDTHYRLINILLLGYYCVLHIRITWLYQQYPYTSCLTHLLVYSTSLPDI